MHWSAWAIQRFETLLRPFNKVWKRMELHNIAKCGIGMPSYICSFAICGWLQFWQKIQTIGECLVGGGSILMISSSFLFDRILKLFTKTKNLEESCPKAQNSFFFFSRRRRAAPLLASRDAARSAWFDGIEPLPWKTGFSLNDREDNHRNPAAPRCKWEKMRKNRLIVWTIEKTTMGILRHLMQMRKPKARTSHQSQAFSSRTRSVLRLTISVHLARERPKPARAP